MSETLSSQRLLTSSPTMRGLSKHALRPLRRTILAPLPGCVVLRTPDRGSALRYDPRLLSDNPPGCHRGPHPAGMKEGSRGSSRARPPEPTSQHACASRRDARGRLWGLSVKPMGSPGRGEWLTPQLMSTKVPGSGGNHFRAREKRPDQRMNDSNHGSGGARKVLGWPRQVKRTSPAWRA